MEEGRHSQAQPKWWASNLHLAGQFSSTICKTTTQWQASGSEVDTGAIVSLISQGKLYELFPKLHVKQSEVTLHTCTGEEMDIWEEVQVEAQCGDQNKSLTCCHCRYWPCHVGDELAMAPLTQLEGVTGFDNPSPHCWQYGINPIQVFRCIHWRSRLYKTLQS